MNHRNSQKRLEVDEGIFAITVNTKDRYPYFQEEIFCELFIEQLRLCKRARRFRLYAFSLMHDHFHMMIHPDEGENISRVMHYLKKHTSRNINISMGYFEGGHQKSEDIHPRLQDATLHFSEGEDGYPRLSHHSPSLPDLLNHSFFRKTFIKKHGSKNPYPKFSWQSSFHDHLIRNERDLQNQLGYIWWNPEKHGLTTHAMKYPFSSYGFHQDLIDPL